MPCTYFLNIVTTLGQPTGSTPILRSVYRAPLPSKLKLSKYQVSTLLLFGLPGTPLCGPSEKYRLVTKITITSILEPYELCSDLARVMLRFCKPTGAMSFPRNVNRIREIMMFML